MALGKRKPYLVSSDEQHFVPPEEGLHYIGVGAQLRDARLSYGRTTAEIGQVLRLKPAHLDALERGEIDGTPGLTYALGYLRSYAQFLGLDGEAAVLAFKAELNREPENRPLVFPAPVQEAKFPTGRVLSLSVVLAVLVYGGYYYISRSNTLPAEEVPAVPAELAAAPE
ncbi:helix-turn-helix domain-containing protein, partial [Zavarzinia sp.]|uniref:helix-turn-helix domain-containing protein n=1 Tax=Zavarzinia sp. TaxID=2027920 RepID=UPI003BB78B54